MVKKMKLPFLNKNTPSSPSFSSHSSSSSSSWPWPCSHQQNPKKIFSTSLYTYNKSKKVEELAPPPSRRFSSSSSSSTTTITTENIMENPPEIECIENVIRGLKLSKRLIFEHRGTSKSLLEESTKGEEEEGHEDQEGFLLLSLESNDPYSDFKESMETMVEAHKIPHDWRSLEKLLFWFLKVNVKTSHKYIFAAFIDLLLSLGLSKDVEEEPPFGVVAETPSYTSFSSSDETSSTPARFLPEKSRDVVCCLSSLFEMEEKMKDNFHSSGYVSS